MRIKPEHFNSQNGFIWLLVLFNLLLAIYATPISDLGDAPDYLLLAQSFLGEDIGRNLSHRSPLYSMGLAGLMLLFQPPVLYKLIVIIQYALLALSSWMLYGVYKRLYPGNRPAIVVALLFNCSLGTIYYANIFLPQILGVFLSVLSLHMLLKYYDTGKWAQAFFLGTIVGLLVLARFNTLPLIVSYLVLLLIVLTGQKASIRKRALALGGFLFSYLFILNAWCLYNQHKHGFYGILPHIRSGVSRNVAVASIRPGNTVSEANQPVLDIFLDARQTVLSAGPPVLKGSLLKNIQGVLGRSDFFTASQLGYPVYIEARPRLLQYFNLPESAGEHELAEQLAGFYAEISRQNQAFVWESRAYSFVNGFRAAISGPLPPEYGKTNLNILPAFLFKIYKLAFFLLSLVVFFVFFPFAWKAIRQIRQVDFTLLASFIIVFSYWGINFAFVTTNDANYYKFLAEPFILGIFVYYLVPIRAWLTKKIRPPETGSHT